MKQEELNQAKTQVARSLEAKLSHKGGFDKQMRRAKRHLPSKSLKNAEIISKAESDLKHPRLRKLVDKRKVAKAKRDLMYAADRLDIPAQRSKFWFTWGSSLVIKLILAVSIILLLSKWLGAH